MSKKSPKENQAEKYLWYWKIRKVKPFFSEDQSIHVELYPLINCVIIQIILTISGVHVTLISYQGVTKASRLLDYPIKI